MKGMKSPSEMEEGPKAFRQFDRIVGGILAVPHAEIQRREAEYRKQAAQNPNRRGPKRKAKPSA